MKEEQITCVANILAQWNPLGEKANYVSDLDGYRVEATDIIVALEIRGKTVTPELIVMEVINQAFDLSITSKSCIAPAQEIMAILGKKH